MRSKIVTAVLNSPLFYVILLSLIPLYTLFSTSMLIHSHDGLAHLPRLAEFYKALVDGQFPVRWAGDLNYNYGLPLFNFIYHLPYYIGSFFLSFGAGLVLSYKLTIALSFVLSGFFMYLFTNLFFEDRQKAFLVTILYQFAPFRIVELLIRGSFGEVYTYTFLPLVLYSIFLTIKKPSFFSVGLISLSSALLIISHYYISLLFLGVSGLFAIVFSRGLKPFILCLIGLVLGLIIAAYYWVPAIFEYKYTFGELYMKDLYSSHFPALHNLFIPNLFNSSDLNVGAINIHIGVFHTLAILLSVGYFFIYRFSSKKDKRMYLYSFGLLLISLFFMSEVSRPIWDSGFGSIRQFQFPWTFLSIVVFASSLLGISFFQIPSIRQKTTIVGMAFFIILSVAFYFKAQEGYDKVNESMYWNFPLTTTRYGETGIIWSQSSEKEYPKNPVEFAVGSGKVLNYRRTSSAREYAIQSDSDATIVDHTHYFPGWRVFVDGEKAPIEFQDQNYRGQITYPVSKGSHSVMVVFQESKIRFISDIATILGLVTTLLLFLTLPIRHFNEKK